MARTCGPGVYYCKHLISHHNKHCATLSLTSQPFIPSPIPQIIAGAHLLTFATLDTWRLHWPLRRKRVQTLHDSTNSCFAQNPFITHILLLSYLHDHIGGPINSNCFTFDFLLLSEEEMSSLAPS